MRITSLIEAAEKENLSVAELAELVDVTKQQVYNWNKRINIPSPKKLKLLSWILDVKVIDLLVYFYEEEISSEYLF